MLLTLLSPNLRRHVGQVLLSDLRSLRIRSKSRVHMQIVYLGDGPGEHNSGNGESETGRQFVKRVIKPVTNVGKGDKSFWGLLRISLKPVSESTPTKG